MTKLGIQNPVFLLMLLLFGCVMNSGAQDSRNGYWLPVRDTLRIFIVYAELANDPDDPGIFNGWAAGSLPPKPGYLFDHKLSPGEQPRGIITKYYYQASFGKYIVLADHYPEIVSIEFNAVKARGFDQVLNAVAGINAHDIISTHGYSVNGGDFDFISTSGMGLPKRNEPDSMMDLVMVIWRVNSKMTRDMSAGFCATRTKNLVMKDMRGMNSYSSFVNKDYTHYTIIRHEFTHLLLGGNNFHTGGAGAGTKTFMSSAGGYAMLSSYDRSSPVYCSFDRRRLGWKHPGNEFQISARDPISGEELDADLVYRQDFSHGSEEFILRDFVQSGDVIRIELPYLQDTLNSAFNQWLWLENHQRMAGNIDHERDSRKGLYAYMQVGKETLSGSGAYRGNCNYTWPVSAFGNYDFEINVETRECMITDDLSNPFTCYNNLINGAYDLGERDGIIYRNELFLAKNLKINGIYPDSSVFNSLTYPLFGTSLDAFLPGDKIGIGGNPAAVPVLTYRTSSGGRSKPRPPVSSDNRTIHLNGVSVEVLEQLSDGSLRLRIRWDDYNVGENVRWCGDIQLHEKIMLDKRARIKLDQGLTPQRPSDPVEFDGRSIFADPTSLTAGEGAEIIMGKRSHLVLDNKSSLMLGGGSLISMERGSRIIIADSCSLIIHPGAIITGKGRIILSQNAITDIPENSVEVKVKSPK